MTGWTDNVTRVGGSFMRPPRIGEVRPIRWTDLTRAAANILLTGVTRTLWHGPRLVMFARAQRVALLRRRGR